MEELREEVGGEREPHEESVEVGWTYGKNGRGMVEAGMGEWLRQRWGNG